ncbi:MAG: ABC transporter permease [Bacteroidales bacterium]|nr:ABC transporter permease [Bacteroidales bacterium]
MKSYLRFLSRNKLYTAIEVVGLSLALAFLIVLGSVLIDKSQVNDNIKYENEIYALADIGEYPGIGQSGAVGTFLQQIPMVKEWCRFSPCRQVKMKKENGDSLLVSPMEVTSNFFSFFGIEMVHGDQEQALKVNGAEMPFVSSGGGAFMVGGPIDTDSKPLEPRGHVVLSKHLADAVFPDEDPIGKSISLHADWDIRGSYTITGIAEELGKNVLPNADLYISFYEAPYHRDSYMFKPNSKKDIKAILNLIRTHKTDNEYDQRDFQRTDIIPFKDIKDGKIPAYNYRHISDPKFSNAFSLICIVILAFALLNYISLTVAFSRFRLKEAATRSLLGTSGREIVLRGFAEALILVGTSCVLAVLLILALQNELSSFFGVEIRPLENAAVVIAIIITALLTAACASGINFMINRRYRPIDVIRGESRYHDKAVMGKIFIGFQSAICFATVIFGIGIMMQTKKMTDYPVGYNTENIIQINGNEKSYMNYKDELRNLHFVEDIGCTINEFIRYAPVQNLEEDIKWCYLACDQSAFDILGFKVKEYLDISGMLDRQSYLSESSYEIHNSLEKIDWSGRIVGILEDFHIGNIKEVAKSKTIFEVQIDDSAIEWVGNNLLVKVSGDQYEARDAIRQFYMDKGLYNDQLRIHTLEEWSMMNYEDENRMMRLIAVFAIISMLMTALAIIALSSYYAQTNRHDTAVRKVFGISRGDVFWKTVWGFIAPVLIGAAVALPLAYAYFGRWLQAYPVRIGNSPAIYLAALAIVLLVTFATVTLQALRLMRTNPAEALKKE